MNIKQKREAVIRVYNRPNWSKKVYAMSDKQVAAVYENLLSQGKIR